jgi:hypothetical protein
MSKIIISTSSSNRKVSQELSMVNRSSKLLYAFEPHCESALSGAYDNSVLAYLIIYLCCLKAPLCPCPKGPLIP